MFAACNTLAPKLDDGLESIPRGVLQSQVDAARRNGSTMGELEELKREVRDLTEAVFGQGS